MGGGGGNRLFLKTDNFADFAGAESWYEVEWVYGGECREITKSGRRRLKF